MLPTAASTGTRTARLSWEQTTLPMVVRRVGIDVVHSPHYTLPLANPAASVVTLHDATFFTDSALHVPVKARFFCAWMVAALRKVAVCVVPSAATASELAKVTKAARTSSR